MWNVQQSYERGFQTNTYTDDWNTYSKTKSPENYDKNWWWKVYGNIYKGLTPLGRPKLIKNHNKSSIKLKLPILI